MTNIIATKSDIVDEYISRAPLALAFERVMECRILNEFAFERPVLDIGCGEGLFASILFTEPLDTGIDPNPRELMRARELGAYRELIECWGNRIPKPDCSYQTIVSNSVIEHIPDLLPVLKEALRLLAPGGHMYITVPSHLFDRYTVISQILGIFGLAGLQERYSRFFNRFWAHFHYYSPDRWRDIAEEAGFSVLKVRSYAPRRACLLNDFLVPFSVPEYLTKKLTNRWTLLPTLRKIILAPIVFVGKKIIHGGERCELGGLVFLALKKPD